MLSRILLEYCKIKKKKSIISWAHAPWPSEFHPACTQRRHSARRRANFLEVPFRGSAGPGTGAAHFMEWPELRHLLQSPPGASRAPPPALVGHLGQTVCRREAPDPLHRPFLPPSCWEETKQLHTSLCLSCQEDCGRRACLSPARRCVAVQDGLGEQPVPQDCQAGALAASRLPLPRVGCKPV